MDWFELRVLHMQKRREARAVTQKARQIEHARERPTTWGSVGSWLMRLRSAFGVRRTSHDPVARRELDSGVVRGHRRDGP